MLTFEVRGIPVTQGSKRAFVVKGRPIVTESGGARHKDWRARVAYAAQEAMGERPLLAGPVTLYCRFALPKPASAPKRRRTWPIGARSGDVDKLARSILDSLSGVCFADDAQVVELAVSKDYGEQPGVTITVAAIAAEAVA